MQIALGKTGYFLISGIVRTDSEYQVCKNGQSRCTAGAVVDVRRDMDGNAINDQDGRPVGVWANLTAWGDYAKILSSAQRGDGILAIGTIHKWEKDGKEYKSLNVNNAGFLTLSYPNQPAGQPDQGGTAQEMTELTDDDDGELPF